MATTNISVTKLKEVNAFVDLRASYKGGYGWRDDRPIEQIKYIAIHHTASGSTGLAEKDVEKVAREHITNKQWGGIGYNFIVTSEEINGYAKVAYVGDIASVRAHTPNMRGAFGIEKGHGNYYTLGISIVGNFVDKNPTDAQLRSTHELCKHIIYNDSRFKELKNWDFVKSHKDFDFTACPGQFDNFKDIIKNGLPTIKPAKDTYEYMLQEAKAWSDLVEKKYGIKLMGKIDDSTLTRNDLIIILHRFSEYLKQSPEV